MASEDLKNKSTLNPENTILVKSADAYPPKINPSLSKSVRHQDTKKSLFRLYSQQESSKPMTKERKLIAWKTKSVKVSKLKNVQPKENTKPLTLPFFK